MDDILTNIKPSDGHSFDSTDFIEGLTEAFDTVNQQPGYCYEPIYIYLPDGNMVKQLRVVRETLTDGSHVFSLYLITT